MNGNDGNDRSLGPSDENEGDDDDQQRPRDARSEEDQTDRSSRPGRSDSGTRDSEFNLASTRDTNQERLPRNRIYEYIRSLSPPETLRRFADSAPTDVQTAMKQMLVHMLGNLPALSFGVAVTTVGERLAELLYCTAMTGYMLRNAEYRVSLSRALRLPSSLGDGDDADGNRRSRILPESTLRIQNTDGSVTEMDAAQYVQELRNEVRALRDELALLEKGSNRLVAYLRTMQPENLEKMAESAPPDVVEAMKLTVRTMLQQSGVDNFTPVTVPANELSSLLFWLMVLGYDVRGKEVKMEFERRLHRGYLESELKGDEGDRGSGEKGTDGDDRPPPPTGA